MDVERIDRLLLECLLDIRKAVDEQFKGLDLTSGICTAVDRLWETKPTDHEDWWYDERLSEHAVMWPEFSGCEAYPVSGPPGSFSAHSAYYDASNKWVGEYGATRIRLLDFLIAKLQAEYPK